MKEKKPKKVEVVKAEKPETVKVVKPKAELKMTAKCITSRAYKNARSKAIQDGETPDKAMEIGTLAFREASKRCVAEGIK